VTGPAGTSSWGARAYVPARLTAAAKPWAFLAPLLLFVAAIFVYPVAELLEVSFQEAGTLFDPTRWVGLDNYRLAIDDPLFRRALLNNVTLFICVPVLIVLSAILSALLLDQVRLWKLYRTLIFLPYVISIPVVGVVMSRVLQLDGIVNTGLRNAHVGFLAQDWLGSSQFALWTLMAVIIWKELGFGVVLFLARLLSVDAHLYEAGRVDGAGWWRLLWHVTIPQLRPVMVLYGIVESITMLSWVFAYVYVMTAGGPENSTVVSEYYIYQQVFQSNVLGVGAAAAVILVSVVSVLLVIRFAVERRWGDASAV